MSGWRDISLGDFIALQRGHDLPSKDRGDGTVPVMGSFGITGYHSTPKAKGPGVTVGRSGASIGTVSFIDRDYWPLNTCMYVTDFKGNDPKFVFHFLSTLNLAGFNSGSAQPSLNRNYIYPIDISVPAPNEQREIAAILGALDDKIELNRKTAATLEEMARALYRSWFVDFDPVHAKAAGLPPAHMDEAIAALFPDRFGDDGLPDGWEEVSIYDVARVQYGAPFKSSLFNSTNEGRPLARIRDLKNSRPGFSTTEVHQKEYLIQPGDIVCGMDGDFTVYSWSSAPALMNQRVCCFIPHEERDRAFLRYGLPRLLKAEEDAAVATTVIHLGKKDIDKFNLPNPGQEILTAFAETCGPMIKRIVDIGLENQTLAALRDTLLPKLMSGALRVGEAREQLEEAV